MNASYHWTRSPDGDGYVTNGKHRSAQVYKRDSGSRNHPAWQWSVFCAGLQIARGAEYSMATARKRAAAVIAQEL